MAFTMLPQQRMWLRMTKGATSGALAVTCYNKLRARTWAPWTGAAPS